MINLHMEKFTMKALVFIITLISSLAHASQIQIIHINDLHSYFNGLKDGRGGYAKIKTKIDELKSNAQANGIPSIVLDAGDWGEGTSFFFTDDGTNSYKALGKLGVDVTVIGNHDHMMGGATLAEQIKKADIETELLSANLVQTPEMNLQDLVKPEVTLDIEGKKIHIIGLSTPEPHHQAALLPGFIAPPEFYLFNLAKKAKEQKKADLVIALTHLGTFYDKKLAKESKYVDAFIGGHSHERLEEIVYKKNANNKKIPIVQTGAHGMAVGSLILNIKENGDSEVVSYKLHDVTKDIPEDQQVKNFVELAIEQRNDIFGGRWDEIIGFSEIALSGYKEGKSPKEATCWGQHMARIIKNATGADIGIHLANFSGIQVEPGPVTFGNLVDNFPHIRYFGDKGWEMSTFTMKGKLLKILLKAVVALEKMMGVNADGFTYNKILWPDSIPWIGGKALAFNLRVDGKKIKKNQEYTVAIPTEIEYVLRSLMSKKAEDILPKVGPTGQYFWDEMESYVKKNSPLKCL